MEAVLAALLSVAVSEDVGPCAAAVTLTEDWGGADIAKGERGKGRVEKGSGLC